MKPLVPEEKARVEKALGLVKKFKLNSGKRLKSKKGKECDFGYVGHTGYLILYCPGERNMQDSWAQTPESFEKEWI